MQYEYSTTYNHRRGYNVYDYAHTIENLFMTINDRCVDNEVVVYNERTGWSKTFPVPCFNPEPF